MRRMTAAWSLVFLACLGCVTNGHQQFYTDLLKGKAPSETSHLIFHVGNPEVYSSSDPETDGLAMFENGFELIGYSNFNGAMSSANDPAAQARLVRAAVVLVHGKFSHSVTGSMPYTVFTPGKTVTTTSQGTVYGTGGSATYSGSTSTYVPGTTSTHQRSYQIDRYDQSASFWVKTKPPRLGILPRELTPEERNLYQRNRGLVVRGVMKESPAFFADFLRGDVILRIGDDDVYDRSTYFSALDKYQGREVVITYLRAGREENKTLRMGVGN
jgi:serine protease Do